VLGECGPFSALADRYGDALAAIWSTPTPTSVLAKASIPAITRWPYRRSPDTVTPTCWRRFPRPSLPIGSPWWVCTRGPTTTTRTYPSGVLRLSPQTNFVSQARLSSHGLPTRAALRAAIHFDVDTIDSNEIVLGLGAEPNGLTSAQARRIVGDIDQTVDVVGLTIAEFIPRQVMHLQQILKGFPLIEGPAVQPRRTYR